MAEYNFERQQRSDEESVQGNFSGGLNTIAPPLNIPYTDSASLLNMVPENSGRLVKRKGTRLMYHSAVTAVGCFITNMTTGLGYNLLVGKEGVNIRIWEVINDTCTLVISKTNVFSTAAESATPTAVRTNEIEPRLIFFTQTNKPIQLRFTEKQSSTTGAATSLVFVDARFKNATISNSIVFQDRVRVPGATLSYNGGTQELTINNLPVSANPTKQVDIVTVTWQWWAEATLWRGDRFWKGLTRFNTTATDRILPVPASIISDMDDLNPTTYLAYPFEITSASDPIAYYTKKTDGKPQTATEWYHSDGAIYNYSATDYVNPSPFFAVFGSLSGAVPIQVYFSRRREVRFRNNTGTLRVDHLDVYSNGKKVQVIWFGSGLVAAYMDVVPFKTTGVCNAITDPVKYIAFETAKAGVPTTARVEMIHNRADHVGTAAITTRYDSNDGSYVPIYGLGQYCDTVNGFYPGDGELYQDRLVLSNFPHTPFTVVMTNTADTVTPGVYYDSVQVTDDLGGLATDPLDFVIAGESQDFITKTVEWQGNLFVFCRYNTYRATGANGVITPQSRSVSLVAHIGCVNKSCTTRADTTLFFVSDSGIYSLVPGTFNNEYTVQEVSLKIRDKFGLTRTKLYENLAWLTYDNVERFLYVGYPAEGLTYTSRRIYVLNTFRNAWTEYDTPGGFNAFNATAYTDRAIGSALGCICAIHWSASNIPNRYGILKFDAATYLDFYNTVDNVVPHTPLVTYTAPVTQQYYRVDVGQRSFPYIPYNSITDIIVKINGVKTTQWQKHPSGHIYLAEPPDAGATITFEPRLPVTDSESGRGLYNVFTSVDMPVVVYFLDGALDTNYTNHVLTDGVDSSNATFTVAPSGSVAKAYGVAYPAYYISPSFALESLNRVKSLSHLSVLFDNTLAHEVWAYSQLGVTQDPGVVDTYRQRVNVSLLYLVNYAYDGQVEYDIYNYSALTWDAGAYDVGNPVDQFLTDQIHKLTLSGSAYSVQFCLFSYDETVFRLNAYQLSGKVHPGNSSFKE